MFTLYQSNQISSLAAMLVKIQQVDPLQDPFEPETILIQSQGMAQWLQMQIAETTGIMGNCEFLYPTTFLWQQYRLLFPELPKENIFERSSMTWRIMRLLPNCLSEMEFAPLQRYLDEGHQAQSQLKRYQLAAKIAELFDQYLVYRPHWLVNWEEGNLQAVENEIKIANLGKQLDHNLVALEMQWQSRLWNRIVEDLKTEAKESVFTTSHRAYLQQHYFEKLEHLTQSEKDKLPKRIFIFGISTFSPLQLAVFKKLSEHCDIHIFFLNPSEKYWGDSVEDKVWQKLALTQKISQEDLESLLKEQSNKLLNLWGKQGRDFLSQLMEFEPHTIEVFTEPDEDCNLNKIKKQIFISGNQGNIADFTQDNSVQIHSCHSPMREVEVLHNQLLNLFEQDSTLLPKDIIVMSPDINQYAPYIDAVFSRYAGAQRDPRYIPYSLSDQTYTAIDPNVSSFLQLLTMKESEFNAEALFELLNIPAIQARFHFTAEHIHTLHTWVKEAGVRTGMQIKQPHWNNYNSWENGLNRLLLGSSLHEENGVWENTLAFSDSYGLNAELVGNLASFIAHLINWVGFIQQPHSLSDWHLAIKDLVANLYQENTENIASISLLRTANDQILELISATYFDEPLSVEIMKLLFEQYLDDHSQNLHFLAGRVNFATLLPMRAIPFKVVCLLGMNEADFPRQQQINSFDLMQYAPQKGDRAKREDDRYLFLEALISAQQIFYISYVGQSQKDGKAKLPSIVVSQLLDIMDEYATQELKQLGSASDLLVRKQPLTALSRKNFTHPRDYSYQSEWVIHTTSDYQDFLTQPLSKVDQPDRLDVTELISFIQNPIKFFFTSVLGVSFYALDDGIDEREIFAMSGLDNYVLLNGLLGISPEEQACFFEQERLKGNLPAANFAQITEHDLVCKITEMRHALSDYLASESMILPFEYNILLDTHKLTLTGTLPQVYGDDVVFWRVGQLRDKDRIQCWLYHLLISLLFPHKTVKWYYRQGEQLGLLSFDTVTQEEAERQLTVYLNGYLAGLSQAQLVVYRNIADYLKKGHENEGILRTLAEEDNQEGMYLNRILSQTKAVDEQAVYQRTYEWFGLMNDKTQIMLK